MKPIKILLTFLTLFIFTFILERIIHSADLIRADEPFIKELFSSIHQSLNLSLLFTFIYSFGEIKKIESFEEFKSQRKTLVIYFFLFTWIINGFTMVLERWILKQEIDWIRWLLFSLLWAVISMLLSLLFSGAFMRRKPTNS